MLYGLRRDIIHHLSQNCGVIKSLLSNLVLFVPLRHQVNMRVVRKISCITPCV